MADWTESTAYMPGEFIETTERKRGWRLLLAYIMGWPKTEKVRYIRPFDAAEKYDVGDYMTHRGVRFYRR